MKFLKSNKGITLVALVVTIIVLLILAGFSISSIVGDNGVVSKAQQAKEKAEEEDKKEREKLESLKELGENKSDETDAENESGNADKTDNENESGNTDETDTENESGNLDGTDNNNENVIITVEDVGYFEAGDTVQLNITTEPSVSMDKLTYKSSDETIATVDSTGLVTGLSHGYTAITVSYGEFSTEYFLKVDENVSSIIIGPDLSSIEVGESVQLIITTEPTTNYKGSFSYESMDESVATVDQNGVVTGISEGFANIVVEYNPPRGSEGPQVMEMWFVDVGGDPF